MTSSRRAQRAAVWVVLAAVVTFAGVGWWAITRIESAYGSVSTARFEESKARNLLLTINVAVSLLERATDESASAESFEASRAGLLQASRDLSATEVASVAGLASQLESISTVPVTDRFVPAEKALELAKSCQSDAAEANKVAMDRSAIAQAASSQSLLQAKVSMAGILLAVLLGAVVPAVVLVRRAVNANIESNDQAHKESEELEARLAAKELESAELAAKLSEIGDNATRLEQALEHAEIQTAMHDHASRRFQSLFDGLPVGCMTFDESGTVMEWNSRMSEIFDVPGHMALLNPAFVPLKAMDRPEQIIEWVRTIIEDGKRVTADWHFETSAGPRVADLYFFPLHNQHGAVVGGICSAADVTESRQAQEKVVKLAGFQDAILNSTEYSIISTDTSGQIIAFNSAAERLLGYSESEALEGMNILRIHSVEELALRLAELDDCEDGCDHCKFECLVAKAGDQEADNSEWQYRHKDGSQFDAKVSTTALRDENGEATGYLFVAKDVTVEKQMAERVRMLSLVAEQSASGVAIMDTAGSIVFVNPAFEQITGYASAEVLGSTPFQFRLCPETSPQGIDTLKTSIRTLVPAATDLMFQRADGSVYWATVRMTPIRDNNGICTHIVSIEEDVTERKAAELKVIESERRFRDVVEAAGEYIWETDREFRFTYVSDQITQSLGYSPAEVIGHQAMDFMTLQEARKFRNLVAESVLNDQGFQGIVHKGVHKLGHEIWQEITGVPIHDAAGEIIGFRGTGLDITAQKEAEDALLLANEKIHGILESIKDSFYSLDGDLNFTYVNHAAVSGFGCEPEALIGRYVWEVNPDDFFAPLRKVFEGVAESKTPASTEFFHPPTMTWMEFRVYPNTEGGISVFYQDVTDRVMQQRQLEDNMAMLNEANLTLEMQQTQLENANAKLLALASTDGLTGLKNHKTFQEFLSEKFLAAETIGLPLSVVLMDVDKFKQYNDSFGHLAGDDVLKKVAKTLAHVVREPHMVARYGGEEFVMVLVDVDEAEAMGIAEEAREAIESQNWPDRQVTASFGVAIYSPEVDIKQDLIERADQALYASKEAGRNRVTLYSAETAKRAA